jgi:hypothetical protein
MRAVSAVLLIALAASGCITGSQPEFKKTDISPKTFEPRQEGVLTVKLRDPFDIVDYVVGVLPGFEDRKSAHAYLNDDGVEPDKKADDDVWSVNVQAPIGAPAGTFMYILTAYNGDGEPIVVRTEEGAKVLSTTVQFEVSYDGETYAYPLGEVVEYEEEEEQ